MNDYDESTKIGMILASNEAALKWAELFLNRGTDDAASLTIPGGTTMRVGSNTGSLLIIAAIVVIVVLASQ